MNRLSVHFNLIKPVLMLALSAALLSSCDLLGSSQPTISPGLVATTVAMTMQAITPQASPTAQNTAVPPTDTTVPPTATSQPAPSATTAPAPNLPSGVRINFALGATSGGAQGQIQPGQVLNFLVGAASGQPFIASVNSLNNDVTFSVTGRQDGIVLLAAAQKYSSWQSMLTRTQDYLVQIYGGATTENFTLNINTPARIVFDPGAVTAQRSGSTPGGLIVAYVLRANAGQKMDLDLSGAGGNAVLSVYGYEDGQPYLRYVVEQTSFSMTLPASEDYIIQVVPRAGAVTPYTLKIKVQ